MPVRGSRHTLRHEATMITELNPYQPPACVLAARPCDMSKPLEFEGSVTLDEAEEAECLSTGRPMRTGKRGKTPWLSLLDACVILGVGYLAYELYVYDELEQLFDLFLGTLVLVSVLFVAHVGPTQKRRRLSQMKNAGQGMFAPVRGELHEWGIRFIADCSLPVDYQWEDFVGFRDTDELTLLYVEYPSEFNFIAASWFASREVWELARDGIRNKLCRIPRRARASRFAPKLKSALMLSGTRQLSAGEWREAISNFEALQELDPTNLHALRGRAAALTHVEDYCEALRVTDQAIELGASDRQTLRLRSTILMGMSEFEKALVDLDKLLKHSPHNSELLRDRGLALLKLGRLHEALRDTEAALLQDSQDAIALNNRGVILIELGRSAEAIADLQLAVEMAPDIPNPRQHLARAEEIVGSK